MKSIKRYQFVPYVMVLTGVFILLAYQNCGRVEFKRDGSSNKTNRAITNALDLEVEVTNGSNGPVIIGNHTCSGAADESQAREVRLRFEVTKPGDNVPAAFWCKQNLPNPNPNFDDKGNADPADDEPAYVNCADLLPAHFPSADPSDPLPINPLYDFPIPSFPHQGLLTFQGLADGIYEFSVYATKHADGTGWNTQEVIVSFNVCDCADPVCNSDLVTTTTVPVVPTTTLPEVTTTTLVAVTTTTVPETTTTLLVTTTTLPVTTTTILATTTTLPPPPPTTTTLEVTTTTSSTTTTTTTTSTTTTTLPPFIFIMLENVDTDFDEENALGEPTGQQLRVLVVDQNGMPQVAPVNIGFKWDISYTINAASLPPDQRAIYGEDFLFINSVEFFADPVGYIVDAINSVLNSYTLVDRDVTIPTGDSFVDLHYFATVPDTLYENTEKVRIFLGDISSSNPAVQVGIISSGAGATFSIIDNDPAPPPTTTTLPEVTTTTLPEPTTTTTLPAVTTTTLSGPTTTTLPGGPTTTTTLMEPTTTTSTVTTTSTTTTTTVAQLPDISIEYNGSPASGFETNSGEYDVEFRVFLNHPPPQGTTTTVDVFAADVPPTTYGSDYYCLDQANNPVGASGTPILVTFTHASLETEKLVTCRIKGDVNFEVNEQFRLVLSNPNNGNLAGQTMASYTIVNDDNEPTVSISAMNSDVIEGNNFTVRVSLDQVSPSPVSVSFATADYVASGTPATANVDYTSAAQTVTILAGEMFADITIYTLADDVDEFTESFQAMISNPVNANLGNAMQVLNIIDDPNDLAPEVFLKPFKTMGTEGETILVKIAMYAPTEKPVSVKLVAVNESAAQGADYTFTEVVLNIPVGGEDSIQVPLEYLRDGVFEGDETLLIRMADEINAKVVTRDTRFTIYEHDQDYPIVSIHQPTPNEIQEGAGGVISNGFFKITLDKVVSYPITVLVNDTKLRAPDTAIIGKDYFFEGYQRAVALPPVEQIQVTIPAGATEANIPLNIVNDNIFEPREIFGLNIQLPVNVQDPRVRLGNIGATYFILDDSDRPFVGFEESSFNMFEPTEGTLIRPAPRHFRLMNSQDQDVAIANPVTFKLTLSKDGLNVGRIATYGLDIEQGHDYSLFAQFNEEMTILRLSADTFQITLHPKPSSVIELRYGFFIPIIDDFRIEGTEEVRFLLSDPVNANLKNYDNVQASNMMPHYTAVLSIEDDEIVEAVNSTIGYSERVVTFNEGQSIQIALRVYNPHEYQDITGSSLGLSTPLGFASDTGNLVWESNDPALDLSRQPDSKDWVFRIRPKVPILGDGAYAEYRFTLRSIDNGSYLADQLFRYQFKDLVNAVVNPAAGLPHNSIDINIIERDSFAVRLAPAAPQSVNEGDTTNYSLEIYDRRTGLAATNHPPYTVNLSVKSGSEATAGDIRLCVSPFNSEQVEVCGVPNSVTFANGQSKRNFYIEALVESDSDSQGDRIEVLNMEVKAAGPLKVDQAGFDLNIGDLDICGKTTPVEGPLPFAAGYYNPSTRVLELPGGTVPKLNANTTKAFLTIRGHFTVGFYKMDLPLTISGNNIVIPSQVTLDVGFDLPGTVTYRPYSVIVTGATNTDCLSEKRESSGYDPTNFLFINNGSAYPQTWFTASDDAGSDSTNNALQTCQSEMKLGGEPLGITASCALGFNQTKSYLTYNGQLSGLQARTRPSGQSCTLNYRFLSGVACGR